MQRIALYSQDTHGLGRMRRNIAIARALAADEPRAILLISGAGEAAILGLPEGADTLGLPALDDGGHPGARCLGIGTDALVRLRGAALRSALEAFRPDALIVDRLPAGVAASCARASTSCTAWAPGSSSACPTSSATTSASGPTGTSRTRSTSSGATTTASGSTATPTSSTRWRSTACRATSGASRAIPATSTARWPTLAAATRERTIRAEHRLGDGPVAVCLTGGSEDGERLAAAFVEAPLPEGTTGVVLTGPFMAAERIGALEAAAARRDDLRVIRVLPGADTLMGTADRVVAMGGYHTTAEALAADRRALMVPSANGRPDQRIAPSGCASSAPPISSRSGRSRPRPSAHGSPTGRARRAGAPASSTPTAWRACRCCSTSCARRSGNRPAPHGTAARRPPPRDRAGDRRARGGLTTARPPRHAGRGDCPRPHAGTRTGLHGIAVLQPHSPIPSRS